MKKNFVVGDLVEVEAVFSMQGPANLAKGYAVVKEISPRAIWGWFEPTPEKAIESYIDDNGKNPLRVVFKDLTLYKTSF